MLETKKLASPAGPVVVVDRDFRHSATVGLKLLHHFHADHTAVASKLDPLEHPSSEEPEIAINVANVQSEQRTHKKLVHPADDDPVSGIRPADLIAVYDVDPIVERIQKLRQLVHIVLSIAVRVEYQFLRTIREPRDQRGAVASIHTVMDDSQESVLASQKIQEGAWAIGRTVIHHDAF